MEPQAGMQDGPQPWAWGRAPDRETGAGIPSPRSVGPSQETETGPRVTGAGAPVSREGQGGSKKPAAGTQNPGRNTLGARRAPAPVSRG